MPYITFLFVLGRLTEGALYQKHTGSFKSTVLTQFHRHRSLTRDLKNPGGQFRVSLLRKNWRLKDCKNVLSFTTLQDLGCVEKFVITRAF